MQGSDLSAALPCERAFAAFGHDATPLASSTEDFLTKSTLKPSACVCTVCGVHNDVSAPAKDWLLETRCRLIHLAIAQLSRIFATVTRRQLQAAG